MNDTTDPTNTTSATAQDFPRATKRPDGVAAPAHWPKASAPPEPDKGSHAKDGEDANDPTRYGDWESKGMAIDF